jgi:hypothetical protein
VGTKTRNELVYKKENHGQARPENGLISVKELHLTEPADIYEQNIEFSCEHISCSMVGIQMKKRSSNIKNKNVELSFVI